MINILNILHLILKGGAGSGNFGHAGVPGKVGGSADTGAMNTPTLTLNLDAREKATLSESLGISVDSILNKTAQTYKEFDFDKSSNTAGYCQILAIRVWEKLGKPKNLVPTDVSVEEDPHTILYDKEKDIVVDVSGDQFSPGGHNLHIGFSDDYAYTDYEPMSQKDMNWLKEEFK